MKNTLFVSLMISILLGSLPALAITFYQSKGGKVVQLQASEMNDTCKENMIYREVPCNSDLPGFLRRKYISANLQGLTATSFSSLTEKLKQNPNSCTYSCDSSEKF